MGWLFVLICPFLLLHSLSTYLILLRMLFCSLSAALKSFFPSSFGMRQIEKYLLLKNKHQKHSFLDFQGAWSSSSCTFSLLLSLLALLY